MIFSVGDHIAQIIAGSKTQTRRLAMVKGPAYQVGRTYAIQPGRGKSAIPDGRVLITDIRLELRQDRVSEEDAKAEGGYSPDEYEALFEQINWQATLGPIWRSRYAYTFRFIPAEAPPEGRR